MCYCENIISDEEYFRYFILSDLYRPKNLDLPYDEYPMFDLESMLNDECETEFRFEKTHLPLRLLTCYKFPRFGCPIRILSIVTNQVLDFIYGTHGRRILQWNHDLLN